MGQARLAPITSQQGWPDFLVAAASGALRDQDSTYRPTIIVMEGAGSYHEFEKLVATATIVKVSDVYDEQLAELFISQNAHLYKANDKVKSASIAGFLRDHYGGKASWSKGSWVYYPWNGQLLHCLAKESFVQLRTLRNQFLITTEEQSKFADFCVGSAGMSVGSNGALGIILTGGSTKLKIADGASVSGSNLNRLLLSASTIGTNKAIAVARRLYELNPYLEIDALDHNLSAETMDDFYYRSWPLQLVVDEIDDLATKVRLRLEARERQIPLIMVTEPGNTAIVDIERYDLNSDQELFNGRAPGIEKLLDSTKPNQREFIKYFNLIVGVKNLTLRDQVSMTKVGSELASPPQLGSTAMITGGVIAWVVRQIALGADMPSGRHYVSLDKIMSPLSLAERWRHRRHTRAMVKALRSM